MSEIRNYGSITADSEQNQRETSEDGEFRRYREGNWKLLLAYYCGIIIFPILALLCMIAVLWIMLDDMPLAGKLTACSLGTSFIVICCSLTALLAVRLRMFDRDDLFEEQQPSSLENQVQNPNSSLETERFTTSPKIGVLDSEPLRQAEGLSTSNAEIGIQNPDSLRQIEGLGSSSPEIGIQNPDSLRQTEGLGTSSPKIGALNAESLPQAEGLSTSSPEIGIKNPDSLRQTEGSSTNKPEIRIQNPDSLCETEGLDTGNPDIGVQIPGSWP